MHRAFIKQHIEDAKCSSSSINAEDHYCWHVFYLFYICSEPSLVASVVPLTTTAENYPGWHVFYLFYIELRTIIGGMCSTYSIIAQNHHG
ncbi:hypothetical protein JTE90_000939 [Oedothorax gibbosus]|uniref:Uncharacterized protein n=1 Tax=Oedothorax gibbosus TaxID=931172 RepID=A0AAV6U6L0_9ARAC|nr:hypothetical protein JTE90_000939 [Oedothorax gibbosus]